VRNLSEYVDGAAAMTASELYGAYLMRRTRLGSVYRRHYLYPRIARRLHGRTLDVGCGIGDFLQFLPGAVGVDINAHTVAYCKARGLDARMMEPDVLPFEDAGFDSALLDNVLEHIAEPLALLRELRRVLRPDGRLLVGVPGELGWDSDGDHKVRYDEASLHAALREGGFAPVEMFHVPLWRSAWLSRHLRQYCIFGLYRPQAPAAQGAGSERGEVACIQSARSCERTNPLASAPAASVSAETSAS
jgi:SAM-dependent methyltransferase